MEEAFFEASGAGVLAWDFEWFACDKEGQIAMLTSAGFGSVAMANLSSRETYLLARDFLSNLLVRCGVHCSPETGKVPSWLGPGQRGLYVFDYSGGTPRWAAYDAIMPYGRLCVPDNPLHLSDLPQEIRSWIEKTRFVGISFSDSENLVVEDCGIELNDPRFG